MSTSAEEYNRRLQREIAAAKAENERLKAALEDIAAADPVHVSATLANKALKGWEDHDPWLW